MQYSFRHPAASVLPVHPRTRKCISSLPTGLHYVPKRSRRLAGWPDRHPRYLGIFDLPVWGSIFAGGYACGDVSANCSEGAGEEKRETCQDVLRTLGRLDCNRVLQGLELGVSYMTAQRVRIAGYTPRRIIEQLEASLFPVHDEHSLKILCEPGCRLQPGIC